MKKLLILSFVATLLLLVAVISLQKITFNSKKSLSVQRMEDGKGIFVGEKVSQYKDTDLSKWSPETRKRVEDHEKDVKAIDDAWNNISLGGNFSKSRNYEDALEAYKKAYAADSGSRAFVGIYRLIPTYEKLGRYDDALSLLAEMERQVFKGEAGARTAQEIRARLIAAKNQTAQKGN